jgi:molybdopterin synthase catalytic subunit
MRASITSEAIDAGRLLEEVSETSNGAAVLFTGSVRDLNEGRAVSGIDYDAYVAMAEEELQRIVAEAGRRFGTPNVVAVHRTGYVPVGALSVAVAAAHPRRQGAFEATRFVIEEIKLRLPIWKREHYVDGEPQWQDARVAAVAP